MKKILVFSHEFPPFGGGAGIVASQFCFELSKQDFNVTLLTTNGINAQGLENVNIIKIPKVLKIWPLFYYLKLRKIDLDKFDHILLNDVGAIYSSGLFLSNENLAKSFTFLHGSEPELMYKDVKLFHKIFFYPKFYKRAINSCKKIIAVSHFMKKKFLEEVPFQNKSKIKVCYAGLSDIFYIKKLYNSTKKHENKTQILLTASRIEKKKGFINMYKIFKELLLIDNDYIWYIAGDGSYKKEFMKIVESDNLNNQIQFLGQLSRDNLIEYYDISDVFWLLSDYKESFGLVYLEAQACGCPVIGYNKYGVKETILNNKTGFLVNSNNEVLDILIQKKYKSINISQHTDFIESFKTETIIKSQLLGEKGKIK